MSQISFEFKREEGNYLVNLSSHGYCDIYDLDKLKKIRGHKTIDKTEKCILMSTTIKHDIVNDWSIKRLRNLARRKLNERISEKKQLIAKFRKAELLAAVVELQFVRNKQGKEK